MRAEVDPGRRQETQVECCVWALRSKGWGDILMRNIQLKILERMTVNSQVLEKELLVTVAHYTGEKTVLRVFAQNY